MSSSIEPPTPAGRDGQRDVKIKSASQDIGYDPLQGRVMVREDKLEVTTKNTYIQNHVWLNPFETEVGESLWPFCS